MMAWLFEHASKYPDDREQLLAAVRAGGFPDVDHKRLTQQLYNLKHRHGQKPVAKAKGGPKPAAANGKAAARPSATDIKKAQLRKLVFELGFDVAREVFDEFRDMHSRWG